MTGVAFPIAGADWVLVWPPTWLGLALTCLILMGSAFLFLPPIDDWRLPRRGLGKVGNGTVTHRADPDASSLGRMDPLEATPLRSSDPDHRHGDLAEAERLAAGSPCSTVAPIALERTGEPPRTEPASRDVAFEAARRGPPDTRRKMDLAATRDGLELTLELPGLEENDLEVLVVDDVLTISGEIRFAPDWKDKNHRLVERDYGAFSRTIELPEGVRADRITAVLHLGLLTVTIPNPTRPEPKKVMVQAGPLSWNATRDAFELTMDLPGLDEEDIDITLSEGLLIVRGEKRAVLAANSESGPGDEGGHGVVLRSIELPEGVNPDRISAVLRMGVLKLTVPLPAKAQFRKIDVRAAA